MYSNFSQIQLAASPAFILGLTGYTSYSFVLMCLAKNEVIFIKKLYNYKKESRGDDGSYKGCFWRWRALSIQPKIPEISVGTSHGTDHFGLVWPEYSGPAWKVVHFDLSGHFGRSDLNVPFHLTQLLSPGPLFCILPTRTITKRAVSWVGYVQPECTVPLGTWNFRNFKSEFLLNGKRRKSCDVTCHSKEFLSQFDLLHLLLYRYFDILPHRQCHFPDHFTFLWNCPPTPPRSQNFALSKNYRC